VFNITCLLYPVELKKHKTNAKIVFEGFGTDQIWSQLTHYTERMNASVLNKISSLIESDDFLREVAEELADD
jgi:hypothetical protein